SPVREVGGLGSAADYEANAGRPQSRVPRAPQDRLRATLLTRRGYPSGGRNMLAGGEPGADWRPCFGRAGERREGWVGSSWAWAWGYPAPLCTGQGSSFRLRLWRGLRLGQTGARTAWLGRLSSNQSISGCADRC